MPPSISRYRTPVQSSSLMLLLGSSSPACRRIFTVDCVRLSGTLRDDETL